MATEMLEAGLRIATVSRTPDHRRVSTTVDTTPHAVPGDDARACATVRTIINGSKL